ncbi:hypothetical protein PAECIP111891_02182 [Paenibacillus allorhizoplanae]|uniref:Uncharacterized protein n=1 Tax=Paenibacillus allorhizoplanae TaxID=2905648 RepID=A0ABM9C5T5_9BACL|nr:hypothetical protein [Paenibacillus allorhizoplanae]CAH1202972.1 hypothetical protein PAECIP111891_02182 [Paenibacillus allorhizoplanae]
MIDQDILNGILGKLDELDPNLPIYTEQVKQGFMQPAFFVMQLNSGQNREMNNRFFRSLLFNVHFFPDADSLTKKADCRGIAERLYEALQFINISGPVRANDLKYEIIDDVLHFFLSFRVHLLKEKPAEAKMMQSEQEVHL